MSFRNNLVMAAALLTGGTIAATPSQAAVLYNNTGFLQGNQSFVQSFNLATPGTLTVTLSNVAWPQSLASLNLLLTTPVGAAGPQVGAGTSTFNVTAGDVFAQWFGTAQGPLNTGVYSLEIDFSATPAGNPVPLPTSIALFLSGLGLLFWQRRSRSATSSKERTDSNSLQAA